MPEPMRVTARLLPRRSGTATISGLEYTQKFIVFCEPLSSVISSTSKPYFSKIPSSLASHIGAIDALTALRPRRMLTRGGGAAGALPLPAAAGVVALGDCAPGGAGAELVAAAGGRQAICPARRKASNTTDQSRMGPLLGSRLGAWIRSHIVHNRRLLRAEYHAPRLHRGAAGARAGSGRQERAAPRRASGPRAGRALARKWRLVRC